MKLCLLVLGISPELPGKENKPCKGRGDTLMLGRMKIGISRANLFKVPLSFLVLVKRLKV